LSLVLRNRINGLLLERLSRLDLAECHLVAGCLFQTVWNCLSGKRPDEHILDDRAAELPQRSAGGLLSQGAPLGRGVAETASRRLA
jgi:hypothetical protein